MYNVLNKEFFPASNDWIFKTLYTQNPKLLAALIRAVTGLDISADKMIVKTVEKSPDEPDGKAIRLDIEVETAGEKIDIEMQVCKELDFFQRTLYYWTRLFVNNFNSGEKYEELKPTICINFLDCKLLKTDNFFSHYIPKEYERNEIEDELAKQFNIYFIELPKLNITDWSDISELELWVKFLNAKSKEDLDMIEKTNNPIINDAVSKLRDYNDDERARELAFKRERAITDYNHRFEKGVEKGIAIGEAKGIAQEKIKNILASYNEGIKTNLIARIFKMSVAEVEEIINSNGKVTSNE